MLWSSTMTPNKHAVGALWEGRGMLQRGDSRGQLQGKGASAGQQHSRSAVQAGRPLGAQTAQCLTSVDCKSARNSAGQSSHLASVRPESCGPAREERRSKRVKTQHHPLQCPMMPDPTPAHLLLHHGLPTACQVSHDTAGETPRGQRAPVVASIPALWGAEENGQLI